MHPCRTATVILLLGALAIGCAPRQKGPRAAVRTGGSPASPILSAAGPAEDQGGEAAPHAPQGPPTAPQPAAKPAPPPRPDAVEQAQAEAAERAAAARPSPSDKAVRRTDGRPAWWIDAPRTADGRTTVAAEALGDDVLSARRAAVVAGRAALLRALAGAPADERIVYATVRPLPAGGAAPSGPRFVGYVLISASPTPAE